MGCFCSSIGDLTLIIDCLLKLDDWLLLAGNELFIVSFKPVNLFSISLIESLFL
jgi:hypothetical protein